MTIKLPQPSNTTERIETGPIWFNENSHGVFIRGDNHSWATFWAFEIIQDDELKNTLQSILIDDSSAVIMDYTDTEITLDVENEVQYINNFYKKINTNAMQFGDDWSGYFVEEKDREFIYNTFKKIADDNTTLQNSGMDLYIHYILDIFEKAAN